MTLSLVTNRKQYKRFVEDAAEKALIEVGLDKDGLQKLIENGDKFQAHIIVGIREFSVSNQYADEEVESNYSYPSGYQPKSIAEQIIRLKQLFPKLSSADEELAKGDIPPNAEGWFAIPRWEEIASTYGEAVQKVLDLIKQYREGKFHNYREGQLGSQYLRQHIKTVKAFQALGDEQKGHDILVVPAQFGLNHRGKSVRWAREVMTVSEFGLSAFAIGIMILTHPERLQHYDDLWIDCAGDEYAPGADGDFSNAPCFNFNNGEVKFGSGWVGDAGGVGCGSASAFLPQY